VVAAGEHAINSKKVDVKRAKAKPGKIFVGGLKADLTDDMLKEYFGQVSILLILILRENF
jgi:squid-like protein